MGFRDRGLDGPRFQMREKIMAIGDDFWIEDDDGNRVYKVNGKALRMRDTFILEDASGNELSKIQEKKLSVRDKMTIESGNTKATVRKRLLGIRDHYTSRSRAARTSRPTATSSTTSTRSNETVTPSRRSRRSGSASATPTASSWPRTRTSRSSWRSRSASTRWRAADAAAPVPSSAAPTAALPTSGRCHAATPGSDRAWARGVPSRGASWRTWISVRRRRSRVAASSRLHERGRWRVLASRKGRICDRTGRRLSLPSDSHPEALLSRDEVVEVLSSLVDVDLHPVHAAPEPTVPRPVVVADRVPPSRQPSSNGVEDDAVRGSRRF